MRERNEKIQKKTRIIINTLLIITILALIIWTLIEEAEENKIKDNMEVPICHTEQLSTKQEQEDQEIEKNENQETKNEEDEPKDKNQSKESKEEYSKIEVGGKYKGYVINSILEIPAINLKTPVLQNYSVQALNVSVTKFWGVEANQIGNYCIAGHNFQNKNMFCNLKKLKKGNELYISDKESKKIKYEIYNIYQVVPEDVSCLSQKTDGRREVTLITCTNNSEKRIIVKAKEL